MLLLDPISRPSGVEQVTLRPAWRVMTTANKVVWAFVEQRDGKFVVTGYPNYPVDPHQQATNPAASALVGAGAGALVGASIAGPVGAAVGAVVGFLMGANTNGAGSS